MLKILLVFLLFVGCQPEQPSAPPASWQQINGREQGAIYRIKVPLYWIRRNPLPEESLADTTKPLCEFFIAEEDIRITIHNFPSDTVDARIPPNAQVARWQRQFEHLSPIGSSTTALTFNGYSGLLFTGVGTLHNTESMMLGWALQLAPEHYRTLSRSDQRDMRADVTIKAVGPQAAMQKHSSEIETFARSFELIHEIPSPL